MRKRTIKTDRNATLPAEAQGERRAMHKALADRQRRAGRLIQPKQGKGSTYTRKGRNSSEYSLAK